MKLLTSLRRSEALGGAAGRRIASAPAAGAGAPVAQTRRCDDLGAKGSLRQMGLVGEALVDGVRARLGVAADAARAGRPDGGKLRPAGPGDPRP